MDVLPLPGNEHQAYGEWMRQVNLARIDIVEAVKLSLRHDPPIGTGLMLNNAWCAYERLFREGPVPASDVRRIADAMFGESTWLPGRMQTVDDLVAFIAECKAQRSAAAASLAEARAELRAAIVRVLDNVEDEIAAFEALVALRQSLCLSDDAGFDEIADALVSNAKEAARG
ncbi:MAG: hypothetical protein KF709_02740 [Gemmatimonadaceae bacterium]|nr:hypothetical protein [Gemmatimonadaceae bacterium]